MFTGFATENTPAIQVWEFAQTVSSDFPRIALADDCAPIQFFKTGGSAAINIYLPTAPVEGQIIKIINAAYSLANRTLITVFAPDTNIQLINIGAGQTVDFCYSKNFISSPASIFNAAQTGWIALNQSPTSSAYYHSVILGGTGGTIAAPRSAVVSGNNNSARGNQSGVFIGSNNVASGSDSAIVGGTNNTASNSNSSSIGCSSSNVSGFGAFAGGANQGTVSGNGGVILGGQACTASGLYSTVTNGPGNTANAECSVTVGGARGTTRAIVGNFVSTASVDTISTGSGISQRAALLLARQTTDATATRLTSNSSAGATTNQVILPNNSAYTFQGTCVANVTGGGNTSGWKFEGVIKRGATAASTALVAAVTPTVIAQDAGASTWVLAITADTTNGGIAVTVTGQAATTIRWVVQIETTEVTF